MKFGTIAAIILLAACTTSNPQQRRLSDPEIAMIMRVSNLSEAREGELAREKGASAEVREFGSMMVTEHGSQNSKTEAEFARADIVSEDSTLSRQIDANSGGAVDRLRGLSGTAFDRAYIERQVETHQNALNLIDSRLLREAHRKVVHNQLGEMRKTIEKHLARAKQIQGALPH